MLTVLEVYLSLCLKVGLIHLWISLEAFTTLVNLKMWQKSIWIYSVFFYNSSAAFRSTCFKIEFRITLQYRHSFPHIDGALAAKLSQRALHEEQRKASNSQHDRVGDEEGSFNCWKYAVFKQRGKKKIQILQIWFCAQINAHLNELWRKS